jgi:DNA polymerase-4
MVAKILSDLSKPDGLLEVRAEDVPAFLAPLPISRLPGVGPVGEAALVRLGFKRLADLARLETAADWDRITRRVGKGEGQAAANREVSRDGDGALLASLKRWAALARGEDDREVERDREARSYGEENTFSSDVEDFDVLHDAILQHADRVARRLRHDSVKGHVVRLKLKSTERLERPGKYRLYTRQRTLAGPTNDGALIARGAVRPVSQLATASRLGPISCASSCWDMARRMRALRRCWP